MCQLQYIDEIGEKNTWLNEKIQYSIRKLRWYRRRITESLRPVKKAGNVAQLSQPQIQPGDTVRVRSAEEIKSTLNRSRKTKGCTFQVGMYPYCGKEYKVYKKVDYFFDEVKQKMCKCNNIFLLDGCYCNGESAYLAPCARHCFFFWQASWLEKA
jgi:hypothetical protein